MQSSGSSGLCELKTRGFVTIIERLLDRMAPVADAEGKRTCSSDRYQIEKQGEVLTVRTDGQILLEMEGDRPRSSQLTVQDLMQISRIEARLNRAG